MLTDNREKLFQGFRAQLDRFTNTESAEDVRDHQIFVHGYLLGQHEAEVISEAVLRDYQFSLSRRVDEQLAVIEEQAKQEGSRYQ